MSWSSVTSSAQWVRQRSHLLNCKKLSQIVKSCHAHSWRLEIHERGLQIHKRSWMLQLNINFISSPKICQRADSQCHSSNEISTRNILIIFRKPKSSFLRLDLPSSNSNDLTRNLWTSLDLFLLTRGCLSCSKAGHFHKTQTVTNSAMFPKIHLRLRLCSRILFEFLIHTSCFLFAS